jgi:hypothetical protein
VQAQGEEAGLKQLTGSGPNEPAQPSQQICRRLVRTAEPEALLAEILCETSYDKKRLAAPKDDHFVRQKLSVRLMTDLHCESMLLSSIVRRDR